MKRLPILFVLALGLSPMLSANAQQMCFENRRVSSIKIGYVDTGLGPDGGYAVFFKLDNNREYSLHNYYNLNDPGRGPALHKTLLTAFAGGFKVRAYDHHYPYCDDVDQIDMYR
jgi:hypothetical protein